MFRKRPGLETNIFEKRHSFRTNFFRRGQVSITQDVLEEAKFSNNIVRRCHVLKQAF